MGTTTTNSKFPVIDITFKGARKQCEIDNEIGTENKTEEQIYIPVSYTPEQLVQFYEDKSSKTLNIAEKKKKKKTIELIKDYQTVKKTLVSFELKQVGKEMEDSI